MTSEIRVDLVSDTSTKPGAEMREAMAAAEVGDEQRGEDPTTLALCERVAELLAMEAGIFLPSGIMCNQTAIAVHCRPGDEILAAENAHIVGSEGAGAAVFAGSFVRAVPSRQDIFDGSSLEAAVRPRRPKSPRASLVSVEQTANRGGGAIWPLDTLVEVAEVARAHDLAVHMDGARLLNAAVASGNPASAYAAQCDSAWLDLSKGLGCPVGGVLAGSAAFIDEAWIWKHRFGGSMRQSGILAAAGLYALEHNVDRLQDDHDNAKRLARRLADIPGICLVFDEIPTNMVFFDVSGTGLSAQAISEKLLAKGIRIGAETETRMRAVTHLDVTRDGVDEASDALLALVQSEGGGSVAAAE
ncbi:MAG: threonine aldolase family protein [Hyphomicrobiaceae bacterium]|nr:threonine aldolase family protein [Hyphomicrobiaceae bacterium]